jgi:hypothetical protein
LTSVELYDPNTQTWSQSGNLLAARYLHTATLLPNGKILMVAGNGPLPSGFTGDLSSAELYDPATNMASAAGNLAATRNMHTETLLPNGVVLIVGGQSPTGTPLTSSELYW